MNTVKHPNSKIITIFRSGTFLSRAQNKDAEAMFSQSKVGIGSYWESVTSQKVGNGLTFEEEELLMPYVIDTPKEDKEFRKKVTEYFSDINTDVPFNTGRSLEIGLQENNEAKMNKNNMPINVPDYLRYRHARGHPKVAPSKEEGDGNSMIDFYIFDKDNIQSKNTNKTKQKDSALKIYLELKEDTNKVDMMLMLLGEDPRKWDTMRDKVNLKAEALRELAEKEPARFILAHEGGDLEIRYWLTTMVATGVLKKVGQRYIVAEDNAPMANSEDEAIAFFKDDEKSGDVTVLKARMQEALLKPVPKEAARRTVVS